MEGGHRQDPLGEGEKVNFQFPWMENYYQQTATSIAPENKNNPDYGKWSKNMCIAKVHYISIYIYIYIYICQKGGVW